MNGKCVKRIKHAAFRCSRDWKELRREYLALPYHRRKLPCGLKCGSHSFEIKKYLRGCNRPALRTPLVWT